MHYSIQDFRNLVDHWTPAHDLTDAQVALLAVRIAYRYLDRVDMMQDAERELGPNVFEVGK
jgi:hypothetical protein